ncbi:MAG: peptidoglycan DD-metalloendopeptidase family protein [Dehalococcoidia bacterium]
MVAVVNDPEGVNLRGGPGTEFNSLAVIPVGTELPVLGPKQNVSWLPVSYQGRIGFVHEDYIDLRTPPAAGSAASATPTASPSPRPSPSSSPSPSASPSSSPSSQQMRVTSPDGVNLRAGPGMDQRVLTVIPNNARVTVIGRSPDGKWVNVSYNGQSGWADAQYLAPADARSDTTSSTGSGNPSSAAGSARFIWPVSGRSITTGFSGGHPGIDIDQFPSGGNPVVAAAAGRVSFAGGNPCCSYGLHVKVEHRDGTMALYAHLQSIDVREGQEVTQGQTLGKSGSTGYSTGAHLHFELHMGGAQVDPLGQLPR